MAKTFNLPAVGDTMVEGEIVEWFIAVGDEVALDQTICSLETDKSVVEMTTPHRGTVLFLAGEPGDVIEVGSPLIIVGEPGEQIPTTAPQAVSPTDAAPTPALPQSEPAPIPTPAPAPAGGAVDIAAPVVVSPVVRRLATEYSINLDGAIGSGPGGRVTRGDVETMIAALSTPIAGSSSGPILAMPKIRKLAREQSIDLGSLNGTGPRGSITAADLSSAQLNGSASGPSPASGHGPGAGERRVRMSAMRRSIAAHLTKSAQEIPQFTSMVDVDATALIATRKALIARNDQPLPIDALLIALMVPVLKDHPLMTAMLDGDEVVFFDRYDVGVAVDTPDGLMVPVVHGADTKTVMDLGADIVRLATAARTRSIGPAELTGSTCTLNNVGALGILAGTPILPLGTSVIIAAGKARPVVELRDGVPVAVPTMTLSATFDHRLIDGGDSGRFLAQLKQHFEVPALGLL